MVDEPGEAKVAELGVERGVEHDVAGLHVAVNHVRLALLVEVEKGGGQSQRDLVPRRPPEGVLGAVEMGVEAAVGHELVDEQELAAGVAPTDQAHQVTVAQPVDDLDLGDVLLPSLLRILGDPFDGNVETIQIAFVDRPESSLAKLPLLVEVPRRADQLLVRNSLRPSFFLELIINRVVTVHTIFGSHNTSSATFVSHSPRSGLLPP
ncbi:hypothetical protein MUK42_13471 [Musa troglodytarum]|uniref:Uncharacterized protein n=1 Tax=Musa troglodytarum TaxID=320322 RepID=A0A9E7HM24_9LILI|nr:hypothetical protein MUK42_13471 [Musa troglodytarum]